MNCLSVSESGDWKEVHVEVSLDVHHLLSVLLLEGKSGNTNQKEALALSQFGQ